jgi:hypothetical protein
MRIFILYLNLLVLLDLAVRLTAVFGSTYFSEVASSHISLINLLKPTGYVMHQQFNLLKPTVYVMHQQFNILKPTVYVMHQQFNLLKPTGYVMHKQFNIQQL